MKSLKEENKKLLKMSNDAENAHKNMIETNEKLKSS
jgi:hypothetical protein